MTTWQKVIKYAAIALAIFLIVSIIGGILGGIGMAIFGGNNVLDEIKSYEISDPVTELDLEVKAAELSIVTGRELKVESNLKNLTVAVKNGKLVIEDESHGAWFGGFGDAELILTLPEGTSFEKAEIAAGAGKVTIEDLRADTLRLELGAGKVDISNLEAASKAKIEGGAGEINLRGGSLRNLDFDIGVGEVNFKAAVLGSSEINAGVGETNITLLGSKEDYSLRINKGIGSVRVDGQSLGDGGAYGSGNNEIEIDSGVGSVRVNFG